MWGDPIRPGANGKGVPTVRWREYEYWSAGNANIVRMARFWDVTYPDPSEWDCCRLTEGESFDNWRDAIKFAVTRGWEK